MRFFPVFSTLAFAATLPAQVPLLYSFGGVGTEQGSSGSAVYNFPGSGYLAPFGAASVGLSVSAGEKGSKQLSLSVMFTLTSGDSLTVTGPLNVTLSDSTFTVTGTPPVTQGTGMFQGASGSITLVLTAPAPLNPAGTPFTFTGTGTLTGSSLAIGAGGPSYPISAPGGSGYPIAGAGGSGYPAICAAAIGLKQCDQVAGLSNLAIFDATGGSGTAIVFPASASAPVGILSFDSAGGSIVTFDGSTSPVTLEIATPAVTSASNYSASAACATTATECWITIPAPTGTVASGRGAIAAVVNPQGLSPGVYTANVTVTLSSGGSVTAPVTAVIAPSTPQLAISATGLQFQAVSNSATVEQFISVSNAGSSTALAFSSQASTLSGGNWLTASAFAASTPAVVTISANPASLAPGTYFGRVDFTAAGALNSPASAEVVFTVLPVTTTAGPIVTPTALFFTAPANGNPASQAVQVVNLTAQTLTVDSFVSFDQGSGQPASGWFSVSSLSETVGAGAPLNETVSVNTTGLAPGLYLGNLTLHANEINANYSVGVTLEVSASIPTSNGASSGSGASCTPSQLFASFSNLENGFFTAAGVPVPMQVRVADDCGNAMTSGSVTAYFPGSSDPPVSLTSLGYGQWTGTWMPHNVAGGAASAGVVAVSSNPALYGSAGVTGTLLANSTVPAIAARQIVSSASLSAAAATHPAPGSFITITGANLASGPAAASALPYPTTLAGTQVFLGGDLLPLQYAGSGQVNALVPFDLPVGSSFELMIEENGAVYSMPEPVTLAAAQPGVFTQDASGAGPGIILDIPPIGEYFEVTPTSPAAAGDLLVIYAAGLGAVSPEVPAGSAAPLAPLSNTVNPVTMTIGGQPVAVAFAGLAPTFVSGVYQINAVLPAGISPGSAVPLIVSVSGYSSPPVTVAIH